VRRTATPRGTFISWQGHVTSLFRSLAGVHYVRAFADPSFDFCAVMNHRHEIRDFINDSTRVSTVPSQQAAAYEAANYRGLSEWVKQASLKIPQFLDGRTERAWKPRTDSICDNEDGPPRSRMRPHATRKISPRHRKHFPTINLEITRDTGISALINFPTL
jgi:hypothetical protein